MESKVKIELENDISMVNKKYTINEKSQLSPKQMQMIKDAASKPSAFDDDSPELTDEQLAKFQRVH